MRHTVPLLALPIAFLGFLAIAAPRADAADPQRAVTINARISPASKEIALNQPLRIDFVTMPRQVENVDIAAAVTNAVALAGGASWRMLGRPLVSEHEKTHTISVSIALLPREAGKKLLPQIPLTWLQGDSYAEFGLVTVSDRISVGGELQDLPKECVGVAGFIWGTKVGEVRTSRIADNLFEEQADRTIARPKAGLELIFRGNELAEATVVAQGLGLEQTRESFFSRWGLPQLEEPATADRPAAITWILGWTRITATQAPGDQPGVRLSLVREDIEARLAQSRVKDKVFDVLDGAGLEPPPETEDQAKERRKREADAMFKQQQAKQATPPADAKAPEAPKP